nr:MAG TPA: hypothetical protein [Caudoviricetes sp.]
MVKEKVDEAIETLVDNEPRDVSYNELLPMPMRANG